MSCDHPSEQRTATRRTRPCPVPDVILDPDDAYLLAEKFKLLSDPSRLRIVYALVDGGELCVSDLAGLVEVSESATSHQLRSYARRVGESTQAGQGSLLSDR